MQYLDPTLFAYWPNAGPSSRVDSRSTSAPWQSQAESGSNIWDERWIIFWQQWAQYYTQIVSLSHSNGSAPGTVTSVCGPRLCSPLTMPWHFAYDIHGSQVIPPIVDMICSDATMRVTFMVFVGCLHSYLLNCHEISCRAPGRGLMTLGIVWPFV